MRFLLLLVLSTATACELPPIRDPATDAVADVDAAAAEVLGAAEVIGCIPGCFGIQVCSGTQCVTKTCAADADCIPADGATDTPYFCLHGACSGYQCAKDADCAAPQKCNTLTYGCYTPATGCTYDAMCDDKDGCTNDTCDVPSGQCQHKLAAGCCKVDGDCVGGSACVTASCKAGQCNWQSKANCCQGASDCSDGNPCTADSCAGGQCSYGAVPGCCLNAGQCDDGDDASLDLCAANQCIHQWSGLPATCSADGDCSGNSCLGGKCVGGKCGYTATSGTGCCTSDDACQLNKACQVDACVAHVCAHAPVSSGPGTHVWWRFDASMDGWVADMAHPTAYWHRTGLIDVNGGGALRYGIPDQVSFETGNANKGAALSPAFTVPPAPSALKGWLYLDVEPGTAVHLAGIDLVAGGVTTSLWSKIKDLNGGTTGQAWVPFQVDLSPWAGQSAQVHVWFDQVKYDTSNKAKMGFVLDELQVAGACP